MSSKHFNIPVCYLHYSIVMLVSNNVLKHFPPQQCKILSSNVTNETFISQYNIREIIQGALNQMREWH